MAPTAQFWVPERVDRLRELAVSNGDGVLAKLFGVSRNSIIGARHRHNIASANGPRWPKQTMAPAIVCEPVAPRSDELQPGKYRQTREGFFAVLCVRCKTLSDEMAWSKRGIKDAAARLRSRGFSMSSIYLWTCPTCKPPVVAPKPIVVRPSKPEPVAPPTGGGKPIWELGERDCHWVLGDPTDLTYCGQPKSDRQYCAHHAGIAYQPAGERKPKAQTNYLLLAR